MRKRLAPHKPVGQSATMALLAIASLLAAVDARASERKPHACYDFFVVHESRPAFSAVPPSTIPAFDQEASHLHETDVARINEVTTKRLHRQSDRLREAIERNAGRASVEILIIGAGLHGSVLSGAIADKGKAPKTIVVEKGSVISAVWGTMGRGFRINSRETSEISTNIFPASPTTMHMLTNETYATAMDMGTLATLAQEASDVPVLFESEITSVVDLHALGRQPSRRYLARDSRGLEIEADKIVFATGMGNPTLPIEDLKSRQLALSGLTIAESWPKNSSQLPSIMTTDDLQRIITRLAAGADLVAASEGSAEAAENESDFEVIGSGDGGKIAVQALLNQGPAREFLGKDVFSDRLRIGWGGQKATTAKEFRESAWVLYHPIAAEYGKKVFPIPSYLQTIEALPNGRFQLTYRDGRIRQTKHIVFATGYKSALFDMLSGLFGPSLSPPRFETQTVMGEATNVQGTTPVGLRIVSPGKPSQDLYIVGAAAGAIARPLELENTVTHNPFAMEVMAPRTAGLVNYLVPATADHAGEDLYRDSQGARHASTLDISPLLKLPIGSQEARTIALKVEAVRSLRKFNLPDGATEVRFARSENGNQLEISSQGLDKASLEAVSARIAANTYLTMLLKCSIAPGHKLSIRFESLKRDLLENRVDVRL